MQVNFLSRVAAMYSFESVCRTPNFLDSISDDSSLTMGSSVYAASRNDMSLYQKLWNNGWKIILKGEIFYYIFYEKKILPPISSWNWDIMIYHGLHNPDVFLEWLILLVLCIGVSIDLVENENLLFIEKLEELLISLCRFNKMVCFQFFIWQPFTLNLLIPA